MATTDRAVSIHPYFKVPDGQLAAFKAICEQFMAATAREPGCQYYGFSFNGNEVHCREAYDNAEGVLAHLENVGAILGEATKIAELAKLEIHGIEAELAKLRGPLADVNPTYFVLEYGIRR